MVASNLGTTTHQSQILPMANEQIMSHAPTTSSVISSSSGLQYSAESLLGSHSKSLSSASSNPFSHNISSAESTSSGKSIDTLSASGKVSEDKQSALRPRSIYSAENFVQSSRNDLTKSSTNKSVPSLGQPSSDVSPSLSSFTRNDSSDGFNFANIGHILSTPTTTSNSFIDTLTASSIITTTSSSDKSSPSTEFTFTLTNVTTTVSTSSSPLMSSAQTSSSSSSMAGQGSVQGQGSSFPFYAPQQSPQRSMHQSPKRVTQPQPSPQHRSPQQPKTPVTSASPQRSGGQMGNPHQGSHRPQVNMPSFDLDLQSNSMGSQMPPSAVPHNDMTRSDRDAGERIPNMSNISDSSYSYGLNTSSQPLSQRTGPPPREQPPLFPNITVSTHEGPLNMGINKSHSEMRNSHKRINEMNQRNVPPKSQTNERASSYSMQPFYATPNFPSSSNPLETAPLRHPPLISGDDRPGVARSYDPIFPPSHSQSFNPVGQNFSNGRYDSNSVTQSFPPHDSSGTQPLSHTPPSQNMEGRKSANSSSNQNPKHSKSSRSQQMPTTSQTRAMNGPSQSRSGPTPPQVPPPPSHRPTPPQQQPQASAAQSRPKSTSRSSKQSQKKKMMYGMESDLPPHPAMFDPTRSLTPAYLPIPTQALSPPSRNMQNEGTSLFGPSNLFGSSSRKSAGGPQNSDLSTPFNPLFPPARPQNGLGFNFQPGFGMNSMHGPMSNSAQITPHSGSVTVTPHMSNFTFPSIFSDPNNSTQNDSLNISPIKFPPNPMLPHQGMDPNSLHHAHQQTSSLYHQHRTHPPSVIHNMNIPSILGHNHHGFDSRGMTQGINTSVAPPFPGHSHPSFGMPPLNFSMHDH
ncbi:hypothetical protein FSP39_023675 [Pinctada imbricata]|uniref:Uncharacterized protein n=1 Tax=Pinctada imbricata TaxID=66713 RepID=A0AA89BID6_PINIB|nr:hypothetical protein FSP39_023675 [Pinctada imbricata]